jgi:DNA repair exonuclease SbcCD ATPase subunit
MKILSANISGMMRVLAVDAKFTKGVLEVISGDNKAGKSSAIRAMICALFGKTAFPEKIVNDAMKQGDVRLELGDMDTDYIVKFSVSPEGAEKLTVKDKDGKPQTPARGFLKALVGPRSYDPMEFFNMEGTAKGDQIQADILMRTAELDFSDLSAKHLKLYNERADINRRLKDGQARLSGMQTYPEVTASVDVSELMSKLTAAQEHNGELTQLCMRSNEVSREVEENIAIVERLQQEIREATASLLKHEANRIELDAAYAKWGGKMGEFVNIDEDAIRDSIESADATNDKARSNRAHAELKSNLAPLDKASGTKTEEIEAVKTERQTRLAAAKFPIDGLSFDESGCVLYKGQPLSVASNREKIEVSVAIGAARHPDLNVMFIDEASGVDDKGLAVIEEIAEKYDAQVFAARIQVDDRTSLVIEDGRVKS